MMQNHSQSSPLVPRSAGVVFRSPGTPAKRGANGKGGYTLIEVLVVAVVVVLMLGMALPVFRVINGSRSEAGASNIIVSMLARARTDAIGLQKPMGMAVMYNAGTQQTFLAEVQLANCPTWVMGQTLSPRAYCSVTDNSGTFYFINPSQNNEISLPTPPVPTSEGAASGLEPVGGPPLDVVPDTDLITLPAGVGVQTICNCTFNGSNRATDGYLNFGVILFDGKGRLITTNYGVSGFSNLITKANLFPADHTNDYPNSTSGIYAGFGGTTYKYGVNSQVGLVVFQREAFIGQNFPAFDPAYTTANSSQQSVYTNSTNGPSQQQEETWLDQNATPLLIDRYTGTLIKAE